MLYHERRGDLRVAVDTTGIVQSHYYYGVFGEPQWTYELNQGDFNRRFNGKETDTFDQLIYYGYRFYDPVTFRWTTADPLYRFAPEAGYEAPQKLNLYAFCENNALRYVDIDGRETATAMMGVSPFKTLVPITQQEKHFYQGISYGAALVASLGFVQVFAPPHRHQAESKAFQAGAFVGLLVSALVLHQKVGGAEPVKVPVTEGSARWPGEQL